MMNDDFLNPAYLLAVARELIASQLQWLAQTPEGNRVAHFIFFILAIVCVVALFRAAVVRSFGSGAFGWGQVMLGLSILCFAAHGWYIGHVGILLALGFGLGGYMLVGFGSENIKRHQRPVAPPRRFQSQTLPHQTIYGEARAASDAEIHNALRDTDSTHNRGYRYRE